VPTLLLLSILAFGLTTAARGDPALIALQQDGQAPTPAVLADYRARLGLDAPLPVRYVRWLGAALHGDLGRSLLTNRPVAQMLGERIAPTLLLAGSALVFSTVCGLALGLGLAAGRATAVEPVVRVALTVLASIPAFWLAIALIVVCGERLRLLPVAGYGTWQHLVLPTLALSVGPIAVLARLTRGLVIDTSREDYVRTARAKGLPGVTITHRHLLRNAAAPLVALTGVRLGHVLGGAIILESIFGWPGTGSLLLGAVSGRDVPVLCGYLLMTGGLVIVARVLSDALTLGLDPRLSGSAR
jgi:ABC-type dipeptide/oligopeptide/nickel transport system permease component